MYKGHTCCFSYKNLLFHIFVTLCYFFCNFAGISDENDAIPCLHNYQVLELHPQEMFQEETIMVVEFQHVQNWKKHVMTKSQQLCNLHHVFYAEMEGT